MANKDKHKLWENTFLDEDSDNPIIQKSMYYDIEGLTDKMNLIDKNTHLSILNLNARSLIKNILEFRSILSAFPYIFDIITIEETWLDNSLEAFVMIDNYSLITKHKARRKEGGGLCIYIRNDLEYKQRCDLSCPIEYQEFFDYIFIEVTHKDPKNNTIVGVLYRPPGNNTVEDFTNHLEILLHRINKEKKRVILTGDTNINLLNSSQHIATSNYLDMLLNNGLLPKITMPTRVTHSSATLIDHIFANEGLFDQSSFAGTLQSNMSDHFMNFIFFKNEGKMPHPKTITYRPYTEKNIMKLRNALCDHNFESIYDSSDPNFAYEYIIKSFNELLD